MNTTNNIKTININKELILDKYYNHRLNFIKNNDVRFMHDIKYGNFKDNYNKLYTYLPYKIFITNHFNERFIERFKNKTINKIIVDVSDFIYITLLGGYNPNNNKLSKRYSFTIRDTNYVFDIKKDRMVIVTTYRVSNDFDIEKYKKFINKAFKLSIDECSFDIVFENVIDKNHIIVDVDENDKKVYYIPINKKLD